MQMTSRRWLIVSISVACVVAIVGLSTALADAAASDSVSEFVSDHVVGPVTLLVTSLIGATGAVLAARSAGRNRREIRQTHDDLRFDHGEVREMLVLLTSRVDDLHDVSEQAFIVTQALREQMIRHLEHHIENGDHAVPWNGIERRQGSRDGTGEGDRQV